MNQGDPEYKNKKEGLPKLSLDNDKPLPQSPSQVHESHSMSSSTYLNSTPSQIGIPFPEMPNIDIEGDDVEDIYTPQQPVSPYGISHVSSWTSATSFDGEINKFFTDLVNESAENPELSLLILNHWNELSKSAPGHPGEILAEKLNSFSEESLSPTLLNQVFAQLDDIRTTIKSPVSACLFYQSCLVLYQKLPKSTLLGDCALDIFRESIITACTIIGNEIVDLYIKAVQLSVESEAFKKIEGRLIEIRKRFNSPSEQKLFECVVEYVDCQLSNTVIINHLAETVLSASRMNTNISDIEAAIKTKLQRFQEILLIVIANGIILENPQNYTDIVPHIEPNLVYLILCNIKPDEIQPEKIDYKLIDNFMNIHKCNLNLTHDDLLLKIENINIEEFESIQV